MSNQYQITRLARVMGWLAYGVMAILAILIAALLCKAGELPSVLTPLFSEIAIPSHLNDMQTFVVLMLGVLVLSVAIFAVFQIYLMAGLLRRPPLLKLESAEQLSRIGKGLLVLVGVTLLAYPALMLALTWTNPPGARSIGISISLSQVTTGLIGALIYLLGQALRTTAKEVEDFRTFI